MKSQSPCPRKVQNLVDKPLQISSSICLKEVSTRYRAEEHSVPAKEEECISLLREVRKGQRGDAL